MSTTCTGTLNGSDGNVICDGVRVARIRNWSATATSGETTTSDSDTGGYEERTPTRRSLTGSADFYIDTDFPIWDRLREGECCHLVLFITPTLYLDLPVALIQSLSIGPVSPEDLEPVGGSFEFGNVGVYYMPGEAGAHAHTLPAGPT